MSDDAERSEQERLAALRRYRVLDTAADPVFDELAALAAQVLDCPTALISFVDADRQWFKAAVDFPFTQSVREISLCSHTIQQRDVMEVRDARADPRFAENPLVTGGPRIRFYAGAPLVTAEGHALGTICGIDYQERSITPDQRQALQRLAGQVMRELEVRRLLANLTSAVTGGARRDEPEMLQGILDGAPAVIWVKDVEGRYLLVNEQFLARFRVTRDEVLGRTDADLFPPTAAGEHRRNDLRALAADAPLETREQLGGTDERTYTSLRFGLRDWRGRPYATCGISTDITDLVLAQREAQASAARADMVVAGALDGIVASSADGTVTEMNPAAEAIYGWSRSEAVGRNLSEIIIPPAQRQEQREAFDGYLQGEDTRVIGHRIEVLNQRRDGETFPAELTVIDVGIDPGRFVAFVRDVSERRSAEDRLRHLAEHDASTGLVNRATFVRAVAERTAAVPSATGSLLVIDLDAFKHVNDTFGHRTGDDCLRHVAEVLHERTRDGDVLARLGGDEFAVLLPGTTARAAGRVAESLLELLRRRPLLVDGRPIRLTASIGVAPVSPGVPAEELLHTADAAMYEAKQAGRDRVAVFSDVAVAAQLSAAHAGQAQGLRDALAESRFTMHAQPIIDARTGATSAYELLVRMVGPAGVLVHPAAFLPAAERFDLVQRIDCWVVGQAVAMLRRADLCGAPVPRLSVNLSGRSLSDRAALDDIEQQVSTVDASRLVFEITETAAVTHLETASRFTDRMMALGCGLSLDDFGAGYASFHYLKHLPVQSVKIDGEFVRGILTDRLDRAVVRATLTLAADMGYRTIAEFVETPELLAELQRYGVDFVQGNHLGRPRPADDVLGLTASA